MKQEFEIKGYYQLREPELLDLIDLDKFKLLNTDNGEKDVDPELNSRLDMAAQFIAQKYVLPHWPNAEYTYYNVWNGVDMDNQGWHTDFMEGYDLFFLYYFDDTQESTGGSISFRYGKTEDEYYPKAGDLLTILKIRRIL
jgi:hypothetical protein